ncbi:MAG: DUF362 domain-containing protein [archaeon]
MEKVYIKNISEYDLNNLKRIIRETFKELDIKINKNAKVLVKPNFLLAKPQDSSVITNPIFIRAVLEVLLELKTKPFIYEIPSVYSIEAAANKCGLDKIAKELKIEIKKQGTFQPISIDNNKYFKRLSIPKEVKEADFIISLPKLKTHSFMGLTLGVKNTFGLVKFDFRTSMHFKAGRDRDYFANVLIDVHNAIKPNLTILDGIIGMEGNGPSNGKSRNFNFVAGSKNAFALDAAVIGILKKKQDEIPIQKAAVSRKIFGSNIKDVTVKGDKINITNPIRMPDSFTHSSNNLVNLAIQFSFPLVSRLVQSRPKMIHSKCISCFNCKRICPAKAISINNKNKPVIDYKKCVRCFCCHEVCPANAIEIDKTFIRKIMEKRTEKKLKGM